MSKFYVENLGCAKNQVDAEVMIASLKRQGWVYTPGNPKEADLIIVNSCSFIRSAQEESIDTLLRTKNEYPNKRVIAAGCLAQRWSRELPELIPELDGVFGNRNPFRVSEMAGKVMAGEKPIFVPDGKDETLERKDFFGFNRSIYIKISDGCNHNCRFCAIPLIKGPLVSRPMDEVVSEASSLLKKGAFELNLIAQDLLAFGQDRGARHGRGLIELLKRILDSTDRNDFWIRLLYLHPDDFPMELLSLMETDPRILPYLDIPFQHASAPVLQKMGRKGNAQTHLDLISEIRNRLPNSVIRSTFLVGHPGEGHREFKDLERFQDMAALDWLGVFAWSREEGTAAAEDKNALAARLAIPISKKRREIIENRQSNITGKRLDQWEKHQLDVLVEETIQEENCMLGRSFFQAPEVDGSVVVHRRGNSRKFLSGDVVRVKITGRTGFDLQGDLIE